MNIYSEKGPNKFQLLLKSKRSKGIMFLVSRVMNVQNISQCTILPCIFLIIWITSDGSKLNDVVFLSILCFFG